MFRNLRAFPLAAGAMLLGVVPIDAQDGLRPQPRSSQRPSGEPQGDAAKNAATTPASPSAVDPLSTVVVARDAQIRLDQEVELASDRPGILKFVEAEEGKRVEAGAEIAHLEDAVAVAALASARKAAENDIEIQYAAAAAAVAEAEYRRSLEANQRGRELQLSADLIVAVELERLRLAVERARLQIENAELEQQLAELTAAEKAAELETYRILTPIDGVVTEVLKRTGEAVQQGEPILRVVRTDVVRVEAFVSVADAFRVKPGDEVNVRLNADEIPDLPAELADLSFTGKIVFVNPTAEMVANTVRVLATVENENNLLRGGLPAKMQIHPSGDLSAVVRPGTSP